MYSTSKDVKASEDTTSKSSSFGTGEGGGLRGGTAQKYVLMKKSSLLLIYRVKMIRDLLQAAEMSKEILSLYQLSH